MTKENIKLLMGKNLKKLRTERNITINELACLLNITECYLRMIEHGKRGLSVLICHRLSSMLYTASNDELKCVDAILTTLRKNKLNQ